MRLQFYEATVQILPVLYLAIVVEYGLLRRERSDAEVSWTRAILSTIWYAVTLLIAAAELTALNVLATGRKAGDGGDDMIFMAYLVAVVAFIAPITFRSSADAHRVARAKNVPARSWLVGVAGICATWLVAWGVIRFIRWQLGGS